MCLAYVDFTYRVTEAKKGICYLGRGRGEGWWGGVGRTYTTPLLYVSLRADDQQMCLLVSVLGYHSTAQLTNASYNATKHLSTQHGGICSAVTQGSRSFIMPFIFCILMGGIAGL